MAVVDVALSGRSRYLIPASGPSTKVAHMQGASHRPRCACWTLARSSVICSAGNMPPFYLLVSRNLQHTFVPRDWAQRSITDITMALAKGGPRGANSLVFLTPCMRSYTIRRSALSDSGRLGRGAYDVTSGYTANPHRRWACADAAGVNGLTIADVSVFVSSLLAGSSCLQLTTEITEFPENTEKKSGSVSDRITPWSLCPLWLSE